MMLKREAKRSEPPAWRKWVRAGTAAVAAAVSAVTFAAGCLDRPVTRQEPNTSNVYVAEIRQTAVDKIDLLFMIDNSISMADKQEILREAVPVLVRRLVTPVCLDENERQTGEMAPCPPGQSAEFSPIKDIHIAIVTSSLGAHGGNTCDPTAPKADPSEDDRAMPLGKVRPGLASWADTGFLAWDPDAAMGRPKNNPPGETNDDKFIADFQNMVQSAGEVGCGYEASLEAWYRFLIDPAPPARVYTNKDANGDPTGFTIAEGVDTTLLDLRSKFLRPDSLVAIIMLTDENDCSIVDYHQGWLVSLQQHAGGVFRLFKASSTCATDPNDKCCYSCASETRPDGCPPDPNCADPLELTAAEDHPNLRCFNQKKRFGFDYLYPVQRYIDGLTKPTIFTADGTPVQNPLFAGSQRDRSLVFLAGIIGVPWQDVSTEDSWAPNAPLRYMSYPELKASGRLEWILASDPNGFPKDGLMYEAVEDRTTIPGLPQTHPGIGAPLAPSGTGPSSNPINGKESTIVDRGDLQYACIFPLGTPKQNCENNQGGCDCRPADAQFNRPLCNGTTQTHAKAYPGTRHLEVLKGVGDISENAIIASICPKIADRSRMDDPSYGYTPAVSAIIDRLKEALRGKCLPRKLLACNCVPSDGENCSDPGEVACLNQQVPGQVSCSVIEAKLPPEGGSCPVCDNNPDLPGRRSASAEIRPAVERQLTSQGHCGGQTGVNCQDFCLCEITQFTGQELQRCQSESATPTDIYGYCYVDADVSSQAEAIVASCPATQKRLLRFAGADVPSRGSVALIACLGANVQED